MRAHYPDYDGGSIVNVMASIGAALGTRTGYRQARLLPAPELRTAKRIVLVVLDGLGYHFIRERGLFSAGLRGSVTSVLPSTTAAGVTTFMTGTAPQQHGLVGWFINARELGMVVRPLPFTPRTLGEVGIEENEEALGLLSERPFTERVSVSCSIVQPKKISDSIYSRYHAGPARMRGYTSLRGFVRAIAREAKRSRYTYAYWPDHDTTCHFEGSASDAAHTSAAELEEAMRRLAHRLRDTTIIITADHGHTDIQEHNRIYVHDHPQLLECLSAPLCGEPRLAFCYVHPAKATTFERYVRTTLSHACTLVRSPQLVKAGRFGRGRAHPELIHRIGDYALLMHEGYVVRDQLLGEGGRHLHIGNHGGVSHKEMHVPLVVYTPQ